MNEFPYSCNMPIFYQNPNELINWASTNTRAVEFNWIELKFYFKYREDMLKFLAKWS